MLQRFCKLHMFWSYNNHIQVNNFGCLAIGNDLYLLSRFLLNNHINPSEPKCVMDSNFCLVECIIWTKKHLEYSKPQYHDIIPSCPDSNLV